MRVNAKFDMKLTATIATIVINNILRLRRLLVSFTLVSIMLVPITRFEFVFCQHQKQRVGTYKIYDVAAIDNATAY